MSANELNRGETQQPHSRKPYAKPRLTVYGDLKTITQAMDGTHAGDGGGGTGSGMNRTS